MINFPHARGAMSLLALLLFASPLLRAQQAPVPIPYGAPHVVNFTERANYQLANPPKLKRQRFIEQGEDRERPVLFNNPVPNDAVTFDVNRKITNETRTVSPAPTVNVNGVMDNGTLIPPDIKGACGTNYIMETTNQEFKIYSKTGTLVSTVNITNFFTGSGGSGFFDPHIAYDPNSDRFIVAIDGNVANGDGGIFLAISQTGDPTGNWYTYGIDGIGNTSDFLDYPLLGFNANWVVVTGNDFLTPSGNAGKIYVFNKAGLYSGSAGTVNTFTSTQSSLICPAHTIDNSQSTEWMVANWNGNSGGAGYVKLYSITGTASAPVFNSGNTIGVNQPWSGSVVNATQLGSSQKIEDGDTRISTAEYINGSLWFSHTVFLPATGPTYSGCDWWQLNPSTNTVQQFGRVATAGVFNYYPSLNVNANGDALMGYSQSSSSAYASSVYSFHASTDAPNTMQDGYLFKAGVASYYKTYGGSRNRWGDYSGTAYDATDGSFFTFQEWANTSNKWATQIARVPVGTTPPPVCNIPTGMGTTNIAASSATFNWTAVSGAASYNVQYRVVGTSNWTPATSNTNSYTTPNTLTPSTNYEWQVQTVCSGTSSSSFSASTGFTTSSGTVTCDVPTGMNTTAVTTTAATFNWSTVSGAAGYNLQYRSIGSSTWTPATSTTSPYTVTGLTPNTNYEWQVQTVCSGSVTSSFTASTTFTTSAAAACNESYEPNNTKNTATALTVNTDVLSEISTTTDNDWYSFATTAGQTNLKITLTTLPADFDLRLYNASGNNLLATSQNGGTTSETIIRNTSSAASYKIKVYGYNGAYSTSQCYTLHVYTSGTGFAPLGNELASANNKTELGIYPNPANDEVNVGFSSDEDGNAVITVYDMLGKAVLTTNQPVTAGVNQAVLGTSQLARGMYLIEVNNNGETMREKFTIAR